jgi:predicted amidohydrolase YtcJ
MAGEPVGGWIPSQKISGSQALRAFTEGAAFASFAERRRGRLTEGFDADFVVFSVDPVDDEPKKLVDATALLTVVRGIDVFRANSP